MFKLENLRSVAGLWKGENSANGLELSNSALLLQSVDSSDSAEYLQNTVFVQ